ncbi:MULTISPECIES: TldD/PmbA family protein [Bacillaceae]|uniref:TldD/PmbA family protein n=1 Tax=Evansella alkalicola TaxID=745819 RepID=A0ABS6JTQ3_9BACI|nr:MULTISPECIES: TldD/PmbA family protein [Bacillaceae]MBU9721456.1 TldD/PmbA family protein [Bacillus alkalicola]
MDIIQFKDKLFEQGKQMGFLDMEVYYQKNGKFSTKIYKGEVDDYSIANDGGISLRGIYKGQMGYAYAEKIDADSIQLLLDEAIDNANILDSEDQETIFEGSPSYEKLDLYSEKLDLLSSEEKIDLAKQLENECFSLSDKVDSVNYCVFQELNSERMIANTKGLEVSEKGNVAYIFVSVVVKEGEDIKNASKLTLTRDLSSFEPALVAKEVVNEALSQLGADSIESKKYPIILKNKAAASLLQVFSSSFSAENVQKGKSRLQGKLGREIANEIITIVDDPHKEDGFASRSFDSEGVATKRIEVVSKGVLNTFMHNLKTAKKDNVTSTGHGSKGSYKGTIQLSPTNMFIEPGETSYDDLVKGEREAIVVTDLQGLHSGANPINGDFSLAANGYLVRDGKIDRPVNQITVAGNFFTILEQVETVGADLEFTLSNGYIGSPSLKIKSLSIGGK